MGDTDDVFLASYCIPSFQQCLAEDMCERMNKRLHQWCLGGYMTPTGVPTGVQVPGGRENVCLCPVYDQ